MFGLSYKNYDVWLSIDTSTFIFTANATQHGEISKGVKRDPGNPHREAVPERRGHRAARQGKRGDPHTAGMESKEESVVPRVGHPLDGFGEPC